MEGRPWRVGRGGDGGRGEDSLEARLAPSAEDEHAGTARVQSELHEKARLPAGSGQGQRFPVRALQLALLPLTLRRLQVEAPQLRQRAQQLVSASIGVAAAIRLRGEAVRGALLRRATIDRAGLSSRALSWRADVRMAA